MRYACCVSVSTLIPPRRVDGFSVQLPTHEVVMAGRGVTSILSLGICYELYSGRNEGNNLLCLVKSDLLFILCLSLVHERRISSLLVTFHAIDSSFQSIDHLDMVKEDRLSADTKCI